MLPELLSRINEHQAGKFILDDLYVLQEKRDGERLLVRRSGTRLEAWNKLGRTTKIADWLSSALLSFNVDSFTLDGELEKSSYQCWDLLDADGCDLRAYPYERRHGILQSFHGCPFVHALPVWEGEAEKDRMLFELLAKGAEGGVFKNRKAKYKPGRAGQHFKIKFLRTATVRVAEVHPSRDRVTIEMLEGDTWREVAGLKVKRGTVMPGQFLEVKYRTASASRRLIEARLKEARNDVSSEDCSIDQLQFSGRWVTNAK